jgi:hypothetical protein
MAGWNSCAKGSLPKRLCMASIPAMKPGLAGVP